jgi:hypothetical protein
MEQYALVTIACMSLRSEPSEKAEITTQLLFGDIVYVFEKQGNWARVACCIDDYVGWIDNKTLYYFDNLKKISIANFSVIDSLFAWAKNDKDEKVLLPAGATIYNYNPDDLSFSFIFNKFKLIQPIANYEASQTSIINLSLQFLNCPYLWGGKTAFGIDCSGLVQVVFKIAGITMLRDAAQQAYQGKTINFLEEAKPADLLFFDNDEGKIVHVGIYLGNNKIIHASGKVKIDDVDNYGIYRKDIQKYTHKLRLIKRIIE